MFDLMSREFDLSEDGSGSPVGGYRARIVGCGVLGGVSVGVGGRKGEGVKSAESCVGSGVVSVAAATRGVVSGSSSVGGGVVGKNRSEVYLDVHYGNADGSEDVDQRVVIELFDEIVPKTALNFVKLCSGETSTVSVDRVLSVLSLVFVV